MSKPKRPRRNINQLAFHVVQQATGQIPHESPPTKNPNAVALGALGASKGGKARAAALTAKRRSEIAKNAAKARWAKA
jgi:hypothetical protein